MARTRSRGPQPKAATRNRTWLFLGLGGALVIVAILAIVLTPDPPPTADEYGTVMISGEALTPFDGDPVDDPAVGASAPEVTGADFYGSPISISSDGRPKVVLFLAHWCPHCQREVQAITQYLVDSDFPAGVDLYSLATFSTPNRPNWPPSAWLADWPLPVLVDDEQSSTFRAFGQGDFPFFVFVDANGNVALRLSGEQDPAELADLMESLAGIG